MRNGFCHDALCMLQSGSRANTCRLRMIPFPASFPVCAHGQERREFAGCIRSVDINSEIYAIIHLYVEIHEFLGTTIARTILRLLRAFPLPSLVRPKVSLWDTSVYASSRLCTLQPFFTGRNDWQEQMGFTEVNVMGYRSHKR